MPIKFKKGSRVCTQEGKSCKHENTSVCYECGVYAGGNKASKYSQE